ncbi:MAG: glycosyltransferase [Betaproteobacteria bacterium]|nr:glycosyltransferase [Betaproteobacteria bacterium]
MIVDLARALPSHGIGVEVAVFEEGGSLEAALRDLRVPVHPTFKRAGLDPGLVMRLARLLRARAIDVVHTHNYSAWLYGSLSARLAGKVRLVHTEHSVVERSRVRFLLERLLARLPGEVVAVSRHVQEAMTGEIGIDSGRVRLVYNGVDLMRFSASDERRVAFRREIGCDDRTVLVGTLARLVPVKNHAHLIRSVAPLLKAGQPDMRLVIAGDGPERSSLEALAQGLGVAPSVHFLGMRTDTPGILAGLDVYVLPSLSEGMNLTLLEAMSSGLPIVATDVGGNGEIVAEGQTGYLVPLGDERALQGRIAMLAASPSLRREFGTAARSEVARRFDQRATIEAYCALYRGA